MMKTRFLVLTILIFSSCSSPATSQLAANAVSEATRSALDGNQNAKKETKIQGTCLFADGLQSTPCASTILILLDHLGSEISRTSTSGSGEFSFKIQSDEQYVIKPLSKKFAMVTDPLSPWVDGTRVTLRMSLK